jgi:hypothetical protein
VALRPTVLPRRFRTFGSPYTWYVTDSQTGPVQSVISMTDPNAWLWWCKRSTSVVFQFPLHVRDVGAGAAESFPWLAGLSSCAYGIRLRCYRLPVVKLQV